LTTSKEVQAIGLSMSTIAPFGNGSGKGEFLWRTLNMAQGTLKRVFKAAINYRLNDKLNDKLNYICNPKASTTEVRLWNF
jgi:hypothetical protein